MNKIKQIFILLFFIIIAELIINPLGEFPLGDGWAYSKRISYFLDNGFSRVPEWGGASFVTQLLWGLSFSKIFGFSFTILRFSQIISYFIFICVFYFYLGKIIQSKHTQLFYTILLAFNPIIIYQSNTFQPDIPYVLLLIISMYFFIEFLNKALFKDYFIGIFFINKINYWFSLLKLSH